jgi:hypothetical protein
MPDLTYDGFMRIAFVPTIANLASPTAVELNGGTSVDLTPYLTPDGFAFSADTGNVDNTKMNSTANSNRVGRRSYTLSVTYVRSTDVGGVAVETALTYKALGFLVVRNNIAYATTFVAAQKVQVYPIECGEANPASPAPDTLQTVTVPLTVTADPKTVTSPATVA